MKKVEGVSEAWLKQYGSKMLQRIDEFCKKRGEPVKMDAFPAQVPTQPQEQMIQVIQNRREGGGGGERGREGGRGRREREREGGEREMKLKPIVKCCAYLCLARY